MRVKTGQILVGKVSQFKSQKGSTLTKLVLRDYEAFTELELFVPDDLIEKVLQLGQGDTVQAEYMLKPKGFDFKVSLIGISKVKGYSEK